MIHIMIVIATITAALIQCDDIKDIIKVSVVYLLFFYFWYIILFLVMSVGGSSIS